MNNIFQKYENTFRILSDKMIKISKKKEGRELTEEESLILMVNLFLTGAIFDNLKSEALKRGLNPIEQMQVLVNLKNQHGLMTKLALLISGRWEEEQKEKPCDCITCQLINSLNYCAEFKIACRKFADDSLNNIIYDSPEDFE